MGGYHIGIHRPSGSGGRGDCGRPATGGGLHGGEQARFRVSTSDSGRRPETISPAISQVGVAWTPNRAPADSVSARKACALPSASAERRTSVSMPASLACRMITAVSPRSSLSSKCAANRARLNSPYASGLCRRTHSRRCQGRSRAGKPRRPVQRQPGLGGLPFEPLVHGPVARSRLDALGRDIRVDLERQVNDLESVPAEDLVPLLPQVTNGQMKSNQGVSGGSGPMSSAISRGLVGMETLLPVGDVELCVDTEGSPTDIPLLLIGTTVATWDDEFVERLTGRFVIRYVLRDTARWPSVAPVPPGYTLRDLVPDAVGVLDGLGIARAHVVGIATGGFIAQLLALDHPSRVASLVLAGTRPVAPGPVDDDLPEHSPAIMAYFGSAPPVDWTDRTSILDGAVAAARVFSGS